ncbi:MAG: hypothetical protein QGG84_01490, partial [Rhodospirillales bacterium]|nr:hypothetical protein [Rhodospirillales bacterium]
MPGTFLDISLLGDSMLTQPPRSMESGSPGSRRSGRNKYLIGNEALMKDKKVSLKSVEAKIKEFEEKGDTTMVVA